MCRSESTQGTLYGQHDYEHSDRRHNEPRQVILRQPLTQARRHNNRYCSRSHAMLPN